jgi:hypothetical protein
LVHQIALNADINAATGDPEGISVECGFVMEWEGEERELIRDRHPL